MELLHFLGLENANLPAQLMNAIWLGSLYSLFALGYAIVFSVLGILNLSHSAIFMWGAYFGLAASCGTSVYDGKCVELDHALWTAIPAAIIGGGILAVVIDRVAFYPLRKRNAPRLSQLISSIGVAIILVNLAQLRFTAERKGFPIADVPNTPIDVPNGLSIEQPLDVIRLAMALLIQESGISISPVQVLVIVVAILLMVGLSYVVARTRLGKAMRTVAFNARVGNLLGINTELIYMIAFFISGALAGAAGILFALARNPAVDPFMGDSLALKGLTVIVLGGLGSIRGAVVGGFLIALIEVYINTATKYGYLDQAFVFMLFFFILLVRPQGILGQPIEDRA